MTPPRALKFLLDIDGTLCITDHLYRKVFERLLTPLGYLVDDAFYAKNVHGKVDADVFGALMPAGTHPDALHAMSKKKDDCFVELYWEEVRTSGKPPMVPGTAAMFAMAQDMGIRCIAVTNAQRGAGEACIASLKQHIPAASIIEGLVIGAECAQAKPHPEPYFEGMRQLGVEPSDCLVFEDSRSGVRAGVAAGVLGVVGLRTSLTDDELCKAGCVMTCADWDDLTPRALRALGRGPAGPPRGAGGCVRARPRGPCRRGGEGI